MTHNDLSSPETTQKRDLRSLNWEISLLQELIHRARIKTRLSSFSLASAAALALASILIWTFTPPIYRLTPTLLSLAFCLILVAASVLLLRARRASIERASFRSSPSAAKDKYSDSHLYFLLLERRELRRTHPDLKTWDHQSHYKEDISTYVDELRTRATRNRRANHTAQITTIIGSLLASGVTGLSFSHESLRWISVSLNLIVGIASGVSAYFKFKDRSFYAQQTANAIEREIECYDLRIGPYARTGEAKIIDQELQVKLLEAIHRLKVAQKSREENLDQPTKTSKDSE